jgi:hypothetical protein
MAIYGNDTGLPQGSDNGDVAVTRIDSTEPGLLTRVGSLIEGTIQTPDTTERVPLKDEKRAIEIALAATQAPSAAAAPRSQTVQISATGPVSAAPAVEQEGLWYVTGTTVNLRGGPSTSDAVVGRVRQGQQAEVIEETADGWFRIRTLDDGQNGYIFGRFLSQNRPG